MKKPLHHREHLRRLVAAFFHEGEPGCLRFDLAASKSASKLAHSKRWRATQATAFKPGVQA